jgi:predicted Zn-dependent protease
LERHGAIFRRIGISTPAKSFDCEAAKLKLWRYTSHVKFTLTFALVLAAMHAFAADPALSDADEVRIGHILAGKVATYRGLAPTPQTERIENYMQTVGNRVAANASRQLPYHFHFDPEPGFKSAFALPGGEIFVGGGILAFLDSEDQLAAILGHEIEHVALNQCHSRLLSVLTEQHLSSAEAEKLGVEKFFGSYGHDAELAADREGVKLAATAGYSPKSIVRLLETFLLLAERSPITPNDSKTTLQERINQIRSLIERDKLPIPSSEKPLVLP